MGTDTAVASSTGSSETALTQFEELRSRQERLRDSVDDIQRQLTEKKKPWYRQTTTLMSVAGTLFAVFSGLYSIHSARTEDASKSASDLETIVTELVQIHTEENQDMASAKSDFAGYSFRSSLRNTKRLALLEQANFKLQIAAYQVSPSIFIVLASEADYDGDYHASKGYLIQAAQRSKEHSPEKVGALFSLAQLCLTDGKAICKPDEGKSDYLTALAQQPSDSDNTRYQRGQLLARVAILVHQTNPADLQADDFLKQAETEQARMSPSSPNRQQLGQYIATGRTYLASSAPSQPASAAVPGDFLGRWHMIYVNQPGRSGSATFVSLPTYPFYGAYLDVFQDGKLFEKQSGQVSITDPNGLRFDWVSLGIGGQAAGYTQFFLGSPAKKISAKQYQLGNAEVSFNLVR